MEDRRRADDKNWVEIKEFITESREYRIRDEVTQKYQVENIEQLKNAVKIQNGRVYKLEEWKRDLEEKIKQREKNFALVLTVLMLGATIVMAWTMVFKK